MCTSKTYKLTCTQIHTHRQVYSHPPAPAFAAGVDVAAAPPSAAGASVAGAGVAKASEVHTNPRRGKNHPEGQGDMKK